MQGEALCALPCPYIVVDMERVANKLVVFYQIVHLYMVLMNRTREVVGGQQRQALVQWQYEIVRTLTRAQGANNLERTRK